MPRDVAAPEVLQEILEGFLHLSEIAFLR
jgi:hypothetical protein